MTRNLSEKNAEYSLKKMIFKQSRKIRKIHIPITTKCNRSCSDCFAKDLIPEGKDIPVQQLYDESRNIGFINEIEISGGEPTLHSNFEEITYSLRNIYDCPDFMLVTNGAIFEKHEFKLPLLLKYNRVWLSHYNDEFKKKYGGKTNTEIVVKIRKFLDGSGTHLYEIPIVNHHSEKEKSQCDECPQYNSSMVSCFNGKLHGCCVAWSRVDSKGILLSPEWRGWLNEIDIPCEGCRFKGVRQ